MISRKANELFASALEYQKAGRFGKAIKVYQESLKCYPGQASAYNNIGNCLRSLGYFKESLKFYEQALKLEPNRSSSILNQSLAYLALNKYKKAWAGYQTRLSSIDYRKEVFTGGKPEWFGQRLRGDQRLFIYSNQGIGDEIQALRFIPIIASQVNSIIWEVHEAVYDLVKDMPMVAEVCVRPKKGRALPDFDYHCEIWSIASILNLGFDQVPVVYRPPFMRDETVVSMIRDQRNRNPANKHVGLVWSGNPKNEINRFRACGLVHYLPLLALEGFTFYSLQKGVSRGDIVQHECEDQLIDLADFLPNMASTATAIEELDLLITTDTSVPHLAGTIGANSWVLLNKPSDWRWTVEGGSSPWYPEMRLFRQERPRDWLPVIDEVKLALADLKTL